MPDDTGELSPARFDEVYCFTCECVLHSVIERAVGECDSCVRHAADGHEPTVRRRVYCHGAGPEGRRTERLEQEPRALRWDEIAASRW